MKISKSCYEWPKEGHISLPFIGQSGTVNYHVRFLWGTVDLDTKQRKTLLGEIEDSSCVYSNRILTLNEEH
jgi:hypothetical protein